MDNRLKEIVKNFEQYKIGLDDPFKFKCYGCGKCCKNREDILLTPRDVFRIAQYLSTSPEEIIEEYCECYLGPDSRIPIIRLRPRGVNKACPFLSGKQCKIHDAKPVVCALYPVGRAFMAKNLPKEGEDPDYEACYILQPIECGSLKKTNTVRQWLEKFGIPVADEFFTEWNSIVMHISKTIRIIECQMQPQAFSLLQNTLLSLLYVRYNADDDFISQFKTNAIEATALIDDIKSNFDKILPILRGDSHDQ